MIDMAEYFDAGMLRPKSLVSGLVAGFAWPAPGGNPNGCVGTSRFTSAYSSMSQRCRTVASGVCAANTLKTILSITGRSGISLLAFGPVDTTSRTHRLKITLDGTVILDVTSAASVNANAVTVLGNVVANADSNDIIEGPALLAESSLLIEYASSLTETDKAQFAYRYCLR